MWMPRGRREVIFASNRGGNFDLYRSTRASGTVEFDDAQPYLATVAYEDNAFIAADGQTLYFSSDESGDQEIYVADRDTPTVHSRVFTRPSSVDEGPALTADQLTLYFDSGGSNRDIYRATRATISDPWSVPERVDALSTPSFDCCVSIADDGTLLYLSDGFGTANRAPIVSRIEGVQLAEPAVFAPIFDDTFDVSDIFITSDATTILHSRPGTLGVDIYYTDCK